MDADGAVLPPIVVRDELAQGMLVEADRLDGINETFIAVTVARRFPNPLLAELLNRQRGLGADARPIFPGGGLEGEKAQST